MIEITRDMIKPGMAHFAGTGPKNKTCQSCAHRGYKREGSERTYWGCGKYREIMGVVGPEVDSNYPSCRYFVQRAKKEKVEGEEKESDASEV